MKCIYADATIKSVAITDNSVFSVNIPNSSDILTNELFAILIALKYAHGCKNENIVIYSDNLWAIGIISKRCAFRPEVNELVKEICYYFHEAPTEASSIELRWIPGKENPADKVSRNEYTDCWHNSTFIYK